ncbi:hypothetical protein HII36_50795 [Nonomuraea sp. NN258]|uniref:hypothetical protein n=1 Tax=Nonomuraea antri TaxID=2730852 RepID=UPI00156990CC|nr:hypothetical protein [Nonomuraea antri]NRQ40061.1 hypothetical protein [Nonomuraea antri]
MMFRDLPKAFGTTAAGALIAAACVVANPSAAAAGSFNYSVPTKATDVRTFKEYVASSGARLQLRMGKYNGAWYRWGRVSNPTSTLNKDYNLHFWRTGGYGCPDSSTSTVDIDGTSYTGALKITNSPPPYCTYVATWGPKNSSVGGARIEWRGH